MLYRHVAEYSRDTCRFCGRCQNHCQEEIPVSDIFRFLAYYESYEKKARAKQAYSRLDSTRNASACRECGQCEPACPYQVAIRKKLRYAHYLLA